MDSIKKYFPTSIFQQRRFRGHLDAAFGRSALGWALDKNNSTIPPTVELVSDGEVIAEGLANLFRPDLKEAGIGTGYHGFEIPIPEALRVEGVEQIHARVKNHNWHLPGSPKPKNAKLSSIGQAFQGTRRPRNQMEVQERLDRIEALLAAQAAALANLLKTIERSPTDAPSTVAPKDYGPYFQECLTNAGNKDLVIFSIIDWSFRHQRPQHLAAQFAQKGYRVIYLSVHLQALEGSADARFSVISRPANNVFEVKLRLPGRPPSVYGGFIEPEHLQHACLAVDELITELSIQAPYCFLQFPSWYPVACTIPGGVIVYDCLDHVASFTTSPRK